LFLTEYIIDKFSLEIDFNYLSNLLNDYITYNLNFTLVDCLFFIFKNVDEISIIKKLQIGEYIIWNSSNQKQIDNVYDEIIKISSSDRLNDKTRENSIDILLRSNNKYYLDIAKRLLNNLRRHERKQETYINIGQIRNVINNLQQQVIPPQEIYDDFEYAYQQTLLNDIANLQNRQINLINNENKKGTIYDDSQNVHNHEINQTVINSASNLISGIEGNVNFNIESELEIYYPEYKINENIIKETLQRINTDPAKFKNGIRIKNVFDNLLIYISNSHHKNELIKILGDELVSMNGLCSTGHVSRLINVIQGFSDIPEELKIKINPKDEIYASITSYLNNCIQSNSRSEELLDFMISSDINERNQYYEFISSKMVNKKKILEQEYQGIIDKDILYLNIEDSLRNYLNDEKGLSVVLHS
jgi:hypothetical protein